MITLISQFAPEGKLFCSVTKKNKSALVQCRRWTSISFCRRKLHLIMAKGVLMEKKLQYCITGKVDIEMGLSTGFCGLI